MLVYEKGHGIVLTEPSVSAMTRNKECFAIGKELKKCWGQTPANIVAVRPLRACHSGFAATAK